MYEYDTYVDARKGFPRLREPLQTMDGEFYVVKSDILSGTMMFSSSRDAMANVVTLPVSRVKEILALNRAGKKVDRLQREEDIVVKTEEPTYRSEEDSITRFDNTKRRNKNNRKRKINTSGDGAKAMDAKQQTDAKPSRQPKPSSASKQSESKQSEGRAEGQNRANRPNRPNRPNRANRPQNQEGGGERANFRPRNNNGAPKKESTPKTE